MQPTDIGAWKHPSSIIDPGAIIGQGTKIWHFCHISSGARIGENCVLGQNVYIGPGVKIGNGCKIQNNVSVYEGVTLEDNVFCGPSCVFTNVKRPVTSVKAGGYEKTLVKSEAVIGANATIVCGVTIGWRAFVGAGSVVTHDVKDGETVYGVPARSVS